MQTIFCLENLKRRGHSENLDVDENIILEEILGKYGEKRCIWLRIGARGGLVNTVMNLRVP
jgi:hypothetical protein